MQPSKRSASLFRIFAIAVFALFGTGALTTTAGCGGASGLDGDAGIGDTTDASVDATRDSTTPVADGSLANDAADAGDAKKADASDGEAGADGGDASVKRYTVGGSVSGLLGRSLILQVNGGDDLTVNTNGTFAFTTPIASGSTFEVTVSASPTMPSQECAVTNGSGTMGSANVTNVAITCSTRAFTVGGTVSGIAGMGLVLQNGAESITLSANGPFTFTTPVASGAMFAVAATAQPTFPSQLCTVTGGTGTVGAANVTSVVVNCSVNTYTLSGTISGLEGSVVLQHNMGQEVTVTSNGTFSFPMPLASGSTYTVTVRSQPSAPAQTCNVLGGSGTVLNSNVSGVFVVCVTDRHSIGGTISGLSGSVVLQNGSDNLTVTANGSFTFAQRPQSGETYAVSVALQPSAPSQICTVSGGSGTVSATDVDNVQVVCVTRSFRVSGTVSGLTGTGLVLQNNATDDTLVMNTATSFSFTNEVPSGSPFAVTVLTQPSGPTQTCSVSGGSGAIGSSDVTGVVVNCNTNTFTVGGTISGLVGTVVLQNGTDTLTATSNGSFSFSRPLASGVNYAVSVVTQPSGPTQSCVVSSGTGSVGGANVASVAVVCTTVNVTVGGTVSGLASGATVVLQNNGGSGLTVSGNTTFTFPTQASGTPYSITVATQPNTPRQTCVVANGGGTTGGVAVTNVSVSCTTNTYRVGGTVSGVASIGLVLQNNGGDDIPLGANGVFLFPTAIASGSTYAVTVRSQPSSPAQTCTVTAGSGTVTASDVNSVQVSCATNSYTVGGTVTGLEGNLVLQNNGGAQVLPVSTGTFAFPAVPSGSIYNVSILSNPTMKSQSCQIVSGAVGVVGGADVTSIAITCTTNVFTISGTVSGLQGAGPVVLQNNLGDNLSVANDGSFAFPLPVLSGNTFSVSVLSTPSISVRCTASNASGTVGSVGVSNVAITCSLFSSCRELLAAEPLAASGVYPLSVSGTRYGALCDMSFDGGGWTQVYDQDTRVSPGFYPNATWEAGVNRLAPTGGLYSILNLLDGLKGTSPTFEFRLEWPTPPQTGSVQWKQTENPLASSAPPTITDLVESPNAQMGCGAFQGLARSLVAPALLKGDSDDLCFWFAVGTSQSYGNGIPGFNNPGNVLGTVQARLWVRTN